MKLIQRKAVLAAVLMLSGLGLTSSAQETANVPKLSLGPLTPASPPGSVFHLSLNRASTRPEGRVLMVCGQRLSSGHNTSEGFVYASYDGGKTWRETLVESSSAFSSEHSCALGEDDRAYFVAGVSNTDIGYPRHPFGRMYLYSSNDAGRTWGSPTTGPFLDWTSMTADQTHGGNRGRLYVFANLVSDGRGQWLQARPALFTSTDGGRTLTGPAIPAAPVTFKRGAAFLGDSVVLDDGTVVTIFLGSRSEGQGFVSATNPASNSQNYVEAVHSTDGGRTVSNPTIVGKSPNSLKISLSVDRKTHTLYAAWRDENKGRYRIMLARSTDRGNTWSSTIAIDGDAEKRAVSTGDLALAVNGEGVVGLVWPAGNGTCTRFAASVDQGRTFGTPIALNTCESVGILKAENYSANLQTAPFFVPPPGQKVNTEDRGVSIRLNRPSFERTALLVDGGGRFHPIWTEGHEGLTELWTKTVTVGESSTPSLNIEQLSDISNLLHLRLSNNRFHLGSSTFFVDATLLNAGADRICGPVRIVASGVRSDYGLPEIDNADNGVRGDGAIWDMTDELEGGVIGPWSSSMPRTLAFKVKNLVEKDQGNPVVVRFKIFGNTGATCG
jgi:hypothetical protein